MTGRLSKRAARSAIHEVFSTMTMTADRTAEFATLSRRLTAERQRVCGLNYANGTDQQRRDAEARVARLLGLERDLIHLGQRHFGTAAPRPAAEEVTAELRRIEQQAAPLPPG